MKIHKEAKPHLKWAIEVGLNLGVRPGPTELNSLKWKNIDWNNNTIKVWGNKTKDWRLVPITKEFKESLMKKRFTSKSHNIVEYRDKPMKKFRRSWQYACEKAGLDYRTTMYDVRHLFATELLRRGADLASVSKLLGHHSTKMTADVYYHALEREKRRSIELLPKGLFGESVVEQFVEHSDKKKVKSGRADGRNLS
jgi:integrase